ncbi:uncharacterized protein JCM6883_004937 [Sporobolomyces salmoneus]|uniref:uncharacterized protein n=1 Tax=Sporobolomyces salmoneus TaxID=183962 RepID=UPI0031775D7D
MNGLSVTADPVLSKRTNELRHADTNSHFSPLLHSPATTPTESPSTIAPPTSRLAVLQEHETAPAPATLAFSQKNRPRAGTLPSTFHLSPSSNSSSITRSSLAVDSLLAPPPLHNGAVSLPGSGANTPLDLSYSPSTLLQNATVTSASRLRSGSLTALPPTSGSLSSAFGPGTNVFSSGDWTPRPVQVVGNPPRRPLDDVRSPDGSAYGDEHVRTLDYLGLDDEVATSSNEVGAGSFGSVGEGSTGINQSSTDGLFDGLAPSMNRLGSTGSMRLPQNPLAGIAAQETRLRSNTIAAFPRTSPSETLLRPFHQTSNSLSYPNLISSSLLDPASSSRSPIEKEETNSSYHRSNSSTDSSRLLYSTTEVDISENTEPSPPPSTSSPLVSLIPPSANDSSSLLAGHRARAATIGILNDSREPLPRRRAGTTAGLGTGTSPLASSGSINENEPISSSSISPPPASSSSTSHHLNPNNTELTTSNQYTLSASPYAFPNPTGSRPRTPEQVSMSPPHQQPTRSLWVGNLDPNTTPADLQQVFAPYGAIESLRLIPDKECGFVNFVTVSDAIRAKEDVLNRLGGQLTKTSGLVRIGYGKAEATPAPAAPGLVHPRSTAAGAAILTGTDLNLQTQPTRALWIGSIPSSTTPNHLLAIFSSFGQIESARVLTHKSCGFVNFERLDDAFAARKALNGREILGAEVGPVRIGFAKVPGKVSPGGGGGGDGVASSQNGNGLGSQSALYTAISQLDGVTGIPVERQIAEGQIQDYRSNLVVGLATNGHYASAHALNSANSVSSSTANLFAPGAILPAAPGEPQIETLVGTVNEQQLIMRELSQGDPQLEEHVQAVAESRPPMTYYHSIPLNVMNDPRWARRYTVPDAPRLREIRKRLDAELPQSEVDALAHELLDEVIPLASDYIGNTIVQKLFEQCSRGARLAMLERIAPHLAPIGTHKNGTWAVQKIIQCAEGEDEYSIIEQNLQPYVPPLLLNDFGNYVVQGTLRFGSPHSDFVFDGMVDRIWEIGSGRFGARSTRQTLESPETPSLQIKRVAISIILNAIPLATSSNGALLLTWLLEASELPCRYSLVAPRFAPHLSHLFTHKLASQSVMRVINQAVDPEAQRMILDPLFDREGKVLEDILADQMHGTASILKLVNSTFLSDSRRQEMNARIKSAIESLGVQSVPAYRKLVEEVGLVYNGPEQSSPELAPSTSPHDRRSPQTPHQNRRASSSPHDHRAPPSSSTTTTPQRQPWNPPSLNSSQQQQYLIPPPPPPPFLNYPYAGQPMAYPPPTFAPPYGSQFGYNQPSMYPYGGSSNVNGSPGHENGGQTKRDVHIPSPILTHAPPPSTANNKGNSPFSPAYPFSPGPGDPYSALRLNAHVGFNPQFSPISSPPPPPPPQFFGQGFTQQQQQNGR